MHRLSRFEVLIAAGVAAGLVTAALVGLPETLGAHPLWAWQAGIVGSTGGGVLYLALRRAGLSNGTLLIIAALSVLASAVAVHLGKQAFVASFAENAAAGRLWYFGWHALAGFIAILLITLIVILRLRR